MVDVRTLALLALAGATGCSLTAHPFAGTIMELSISGAKVSAPGTHFELWARSQYDDIVRVNGINDNRNDPKFNDSQGRPRFPGGSPGFQVVRAITMSDPCMINLKTGALLTKAEAYPTNDTIAGITQTPDQQAEQVRNRVAQLTTTDDCDPDGRCGNQSPTSPGPLLALVAWDETPRLVTCPSTGAQPANCIPWTTAPADRLHACQTNYWNLSPNAYTPNPGQITGPLHGIVFGFPSYTATKPPTTDDDIRIDSPIHLKGLKELFFTTEGATVDPIVRGPLFLQGLPDAGGRAIVHFDLSGPSASGSAALYVDLETDPVQF